MDRFCPARAEHFLLGAARIFRRLSAEVLDRAVRRCREDEQGERLTETSPPILAFAQCSLDQLSVGDVDAATGEARRSPGGIALGNSAREVPTVRAVLVPNSELMAPLPRLTVEERLS
jgi:hypothetical protein